ncbi:hypothetical protein [Sediminicola sp. 1XM1-17]|uniref:hypothetical protein n=1 Tax=Sediminicola sp. 1XM1-17 TaxID=3127702 RepID=UPI00307881F5
MEVPILKSIGIFFAINFIFLDNGQPWVCSKGAGSMLLGSTRGGQGKDTLGKDSSGHLVLEKI